MINIIDVQRVVDFMSGLPYHVKLLTAITQTKLKELNQEGYIFLAIKEADEPVYPKAIEVRNKFEIGFNMLMEYWDSISDEEKPKLHKRLNKIGL